MRHQQVKVYQKRDSVDPEVFGVRSTAMTLALGAARPMDASGPHAMTMLRTLRPSLMRFLFRFFAALLAKAVYEGKCL